MLDVISRPGISMMRLKLMKNSSKHKCTEKISNDIDDDGSEVEWYKILKLYYFRERISISSFF